MFFDIKKEAYNNSMSDQPLHFHKSLDSILDTFRIVIASITYLHVNIKSAQLFYRDFPYIIELSSSMADQDIKISKSILSILKNDNDGQSTPLYSKTLIDYYRIFTIAIMDTIREESAFSSLLSTPELQFFRHLRNASAHSNRFYWGSGSSRARTIEGLPIVWRGKEINEGLENSQVYMDFLKPGDIFLLLSDISSLVA